MDPTDPKTESIAPVQSADSRTNAQAVSDRVPFLETTLAASSNCSDPITLNECCFSLNPTRYRIRTAIGEGGTGEVVGAYDRQLARDVALKSLKRSTQSSSEGRETTSALSELEYRFVREARITGRLIHPAIIPVYELGQRDDGSLYYTMPIVRGNTLHKLLDQRDLRGRLELLPNFVDLCEAVAFAHNQGIVHRDLKPENVMIGDFGETITIDWGLAKHRESDEHPLPTATTLPPLSEQISNLKTIDGVLLGTPIFMPPEQAAGDLTKIDERSDIYSLGAILYQLLSGQFPVRGNSLLEVLDNVINANITPIHEFEPACPPALAAIAVRALNKNKEDRYQSVKALIADIRAFQTDGLVRAHQYTPKELFLRWLQHHKQPVLAIAIALISMGSVWFYRTWSDQREATAKENHRQQAVRAEIRTLLNGVKEISPHSTAFNTYVFRAISLAEPLVENLFISQLDNSDADIQRFVVCALGGMRSRRAVDALINRLNPAAKSSEKMIIEVINALGVIGDSRADRAVDRTRFRYGEYSYVWKNTDLAYRMIPIERIDKTAKLSAEQWTNRGRALFNKQQYDDALKAFNQAIAQDASYFRAYANRAIVYSRQRNIAAALSDLERAIATVPKKDKWKLLNNRAVESLQLGFADSALKDANQAVALISNPTVLVNRARIYRELGDFTRALADLDRAQQLEPTRPSTYYTRAFFWFARGKFSEALSSVDRSLALNPLYASALLLRSQIYRLQAMNDLALNDLDHALQLDANQEYAILFRAALWEELSRSEEAVQEFDRAVQTYRDQPSVWVARATLHHAYREHFESAAGDLVKAISLAEVTDEVHFQLLLAGIALRLGDVHRAQKAIAQPRANDVGGWLRSLIQYANGKLPLPAIEKDAFDLFRQCELALVRGIRAELNGKRVAAAAAYGSANSIPLPTNFACALSRVAYRSLIASGT